MCAFARQGGKYGIQHLLGDLTHGIESQDMLASAATIVTILLKPVSCEVPNIMEVQ